MTKINKNKQDFPLDGALGKFVTWLVPQREPNLSTNLVHSYPSQTFVSLVRNILREKNAVWFLVTGYLLEAIFSTIYVLMPLVLGKFIALMLEGNGIDTDKLFQLALLSTGLLFICAIINFFSVRQADRSRAVGEALTRRQLTWWALGHSAGWFAVREAGQIAHRIAEISRQVNVVLGLIIWDIAPIIIALTAVTIVMYATDFQAGLFFSFWTVIFLISSIKLGLISQKFMMRTVKRRAEASGFVTDVIINNALVRLFDARSIEDQKVDDYSQQCFESFMEISTWARIKNIIRDLLIMVLIGTIIWILGSALIEGRITAAAFVGSTGTLFVLISQIRVLHHIIRDMMEAIGSIREGLIEIGTPHEITDIVTDRTDLDGTDIQLNHIHFNYQKSKIVLQDINLSIPEGQKIGLIGPSGAGKTTLMSLILRLWDVENGHITIGQKDIKDIPLGLLRQNMALIPQDTSLFHRSLMENIRYGRLEANDDEVVEAAKKAYAHDFIQDLSDGYETLVGERGVKLSGGQRQRIAIARAILKNAPILILDEATSALDSESEKLIQESLKQLMDGKTVIAIAHRLSTIAHLDRLIVMHEGKIVEDGTHEQLLKNKNLYAKLWNMQSGGFLSA